MSSIFPNGTTGGGSMAIGSGVTGSAAKSVLYIDAGGNLAQNNTNFKFDYTNLFLQLGTGAGATTTASTLSVFAKTSNNFCDFDIENRSNGTSASCDYIIGNDAATDTTNYFDIGLNSSTNTDASYTQFLPGEAYIYNQSAGLNIGTAGVFNIKFFAGGTLLANEKMRILGAAPGATGQVVTISNAGTGILSAGITSTSYSAIWLNGGTSAFNYNMAFNGTDVVFNTSPSGKFIFASNANSQLEFATAGTIGKYNAISTAGKGVAAIYAANRVTAQTAANSSIATYTNGGSDASFEVSANINVVTSTVHSFTVECAYTDENNTARVMTFPIAQLGGALIASGLITAGTGPGPYSSPVMHIRAKASTSITIRTNAGGTYTTVSYNGEGVIKQSQ